MPNLADFEDECNCCCESCCDCYDTDTDTDYAPLIRSYGTEFESLRFYRLNDTNSCRNFSYSEVDYDEALDVTRDLYLGLEIETQFNDRYSRDTYLEKLHDYGKKHLGGLSTICIPQYDGSLSRYMGVELVFQPHTLPALRKRFSLIPMPEKSNLYLENENVGIHVNMNRGYANSDQWSMFVRFIHVLKELCVDFAGRNNREYSRYIDKENLPVRDSFGGTYQLLNSLGKYTAVYVQYSRVEVRIFKSVFEYETIIRYAEFCKYLIDFCKKITVEDFLFFEDGNCLAEAFNFYVKNGYVTKSIKQLLKIEGEKLCV